MNAVLEPKLAVAKPLALSFVVDSQEVGARLDAAVVAQANRRGLALSRAQVARLIDTGHVTLGARVAKAGQRVVLGERIEWTMPDVSDPADLRPISMPLDLLFEDEHLLVLNKAPHLPVHPGAGKERATLVHGLLARDTQWSGIGGVARPGIVHRLDADTTGALVVAKHDEAHRALAAQFAAREVRKQYLALCAGELPKGFPAKGLIDTAFARHPVHRHRYTGRLSSSTRRARTSYRVLETHGGRTLVELRLWTGRTHQARVHLAEMRLPVFGDAMYGSARALAEARALGVTHHALHAWKLAFRHPVTKAKMQFVAPAPLTWASLSPLAQRVAVCDSQRPYEIMAGTEVPTNVA